MKNNHSKFIELREKYPQFIYSTFHWKRENENTLSLQYHFEAMSASSGESFSFSPQTSITLPPGIFPELSENEKKRLDFLVFQLGMVELISYWKFACPPKVVVKAGHLSESEISWWKKLYFRGLGEFFFANTIHTDLDSFLELEAAGPDLGGRSHDERELRSGAAMIPVGGGKDSALTLDLLKERHDNFFFAINPIPSALKCLEVADPGFSKTVRVKRVIDPFLLELNARGYLNGHTPFSAVIAFTSAIAAWLTGVKHIVLSNEASANQGNILFNGIEVNHQYSKTLEFENDFRTYCRDHLKLGVNYFSLLRPLHEIQIAKAFAARPVYHPVFNSCNVGGRENAWCGKCPKCLFTYIMLAPFLNDEALVKIFGSNLLENADLKELFIDLTGLGKHKPLECVGTYEEVCFALDQKARQYSGSDSLPALLALFLELNAPVGASSSGLEPHNVSDEFMPYIKELL